MSDSVAEIIQFTLEDLNEKTDKRVFPTLLETFLYAVFVVFIVVSTCVLVTRRPRSRANNAMLAVTLLLFALSTISWASDIRLLWNDLKIIAPTELSAALDTSKPVDYSPNLNVPWELSSSVSSDLCAIISDSVVAWRAWIVCGRDRRVAITAVIMIIGFLGATVLGKLINFSQYGVIDPLPTLAKQQLGIDIAWFGISAAINTLSTSVIAYKAWSHRRDVRRFFRDGSGSYKRIQRILTLVVDTGVMYTSLWIVYCASQLIGANNWETDPSPFTYYFIGIMNQVTGLYPTIIVVLVALQKSHIDNQFTYGSARNAPGRVEGTLSEFAVHIPFESSLSITGAGGHIVSRHAIGTREECPSIVAISDEGEGHGNAEKMV